MRHGKLDRTYLPVFHHEPLNNEIPTPFGKTRTGTFKHPMQPIDNVWAILKKGSKIVIALLAIPPFV